MDMINLVKSIISGTGNKFASNIKNDADLITNPQRRKEYEDKTIDFASRNAGFSGGVKAVEQPAALALKMLSKSPKPLGISSADATDAMRDTVSKIASKALSQGDKFKDINNWGIIDEIMKKVQKGKETPEELRQLAETLQLSGFNMINPTKRMLK